MFTLNTTIDDSDPLIVYDPPEAWNQGDNTTDIGSIYWGGTKTWTNSYRATAAIRFNGTAVTVAGAKRFNHGTYSVRLDGMYYSFNGFASPGEYQVVLFNATNLSQGIHDLLITNTGTEGEYFDIDYIQWNSAVGNDHARTQQYTSVNVQDTDKSFTYGPTGTWNMNPELAAQFSGSSGHSSSVPGAFMNYTFQGILSDAVSLYGTVGPQNSQYQVSLDNQNVGTFSANRQLFRAQVLLYHADNLGPGSHVLTITNADASASLLEIDYASVFQEISSSRPMETSSSAFPTSSNTPSSSSNTNAALTTGIIIITTLTVLFIITLILLVWFLNRRNKMLWARLQKNYMVQNQFDSPPPTMRSLAVATHGGSSRETSESSYRTKGYLYDTTPPLPEPPPPPHQLPAGAAAPRAYRNDYQPLPVPLRSDTVNTDSTLVAENGSEVDWPVARQVTLKLVPKWGTTAPSRGCSMKRPLLSEISEGSGEDDIPQANSQVEEDFDGDITEYSPPPYRRSVPLPRGPRYR